MMILKESILNYINNKNKDEFDPYYIYDIQTIKAQCNKFRKIDYQNKSIHFATMANINPDFLSYIKEENIKVFVNSVLHLRAVMKAGYKDDEIIFTSSALTKKTMKIIHDNGVQVNLDSPLQLEQWRRLFPDFPVGIRCNIGDAVAPYSNHAGAFIGKQSRLGFSLEEIDEIENKEMINALHMYVGTDITDIDYFINCYSALIDISKKFPKLVSLNFGGGFGVSENGDDEFNFVDYNQRVTKLMNNTSHEYGKNLHLILEPGRIIGGAAGVFVCHVTDIKKRGNEYLVGVNASTAQFPRPLMYPETAIHPVMIVRDGKQLLSESCCKTKIYGSSTYSRDIFSNNIMLPELQMGDIVVLGNAGSYSASSYCEFLGFEKPVEIFI